MKVTYRREIKHNYLIIDPEDLDWNGYESQMMMRNPVEGLLDFKIRPTEEGVRFYYEITSKQPLIRVLQTQKIKADEIRNLMIGIFSTLERMEQYMLQERRILLEPEFLYIDPESFRVGLCLVPGMDRDFAEDFSKLLGQILESVDHQDKKSVVLAYGLYQETRKENYGIADVMNFLSRAYCDESQKDRIELMTAGRTEPVKNAEIMNDTMPHNTAVNHIIPNAMRQNAGMKKAVVQKEERRKAPRHGKSRKQNEPGAGKMISAEKQNNGQSMEHQKQKRQNIWWKRWWNWLTNKLRSEQDAAPVRVSWEMMFQEEEDKDLYFGELSEEASPNDNAVMEQGTILLADLTIDNSCRILRALDTGEPDIPISYYPFIIGKQEHLVDYCLNKDTVSRLHLRIDRNGERYQIQDLNSTNGTMLNGKWMNNNETNEIRIGDEISIARYRYRFE